MGGLASVTAVEAENHLEADLQTLRGIVEALDRLEERLNVSPIPEAVTERGYFTPEEDDRVRQGVLVYRNCRLAAYEIILRYRAYASMESETCRLRCFLVAFGAALVLYAKSLRIIDFAEHVPMLRAKINEADSKYDMEEGFFDEVLAGYSRICNYRSIARGDAFWRKHRAQASALAVRAGGDWSWLVHLIQHQRHAVRNRLMHVLWERLHHDWRAFGRTLLSPFQKARHGVEGRRADRLAQADGMGEGSGGIPFELLARLRSRLRPGDVLLMRNDSRVTAAILPGFWIHAAIFLGDKSDLERLGLKTHPYLEKHWNRIPEPSGPLGIVIEALAPRVKLNPLDKCLCADHVVALRSSLSDTEIAAAIGEAFGHFDKPYDFEFDFNSSARIVCTGLVYRCYQSRGSVAFSLTKRLGRFTLTGDDIIAYALDHLNRAGAIPLKPVALLLKRRDRQLRDVPSERIEPLLRRIRQGWRPARHMKSRSVASRTG